MVRLVRGRFGPGAGRARLLPSARAVEHHADKGDAAADDLRRQVLRFKARRLATAPKAVRQRAYRMEEIEQSQAWAETLKNMVLEAYAKRSEK